MLKITIEHDGGTELIDLAVEEQKAIEVVLFDPVEWIRNVVREQVRRAVDQIVKENSDKNPKKTDIAEKLIIVDGADIKSAKEVQEAYEAKELESMEEPKAD